MPMTPVAQMKLLAEIEEDVAQVRKDVDATIIVLRGVIEDADFLYQQDRVLAHRQIANRVDNIRARARYALRKLTGEET